MFAPVTLFHRILVATDESAAGMVATAVGQRIAEREGSTLFLLRVEPERAPLPQVFADAVCSYYRIEHGNPAENIAVVAAEEGASRILAAHHHRGLLDGTPPKRLREALLVRPTPLLIWSDAPRRRP